MFYKDFLRSIYRFFLKPLQRKTKRLFVNIFARVGIYPIGLTDKNEIQSLIQKLQSVSTDKKLIRLGSKGDGGYLVPDDLGGVEACFSPGIGDNSDFEKDCADMGMDVFLADASVDQPAGSHECFHFTKKNLGVINKDQFMNISNWVEDSVPDSQKDLLLQIDIEGYEYEVFLGAPSSLLDRFRIIVAEFHQLNRLWGASYFQLASKAFDKILQTHTCVHIHPNNCCGSVKRKGLEIPRVAEFTFLRNDRIKSTSPANDFPHPLDYDNTDNPSLSLPKCWYSAT